MAVIYSPGRHGEGRRGMSFNQNPHEEVGCDRFQILLMVNCG